MDQHVKKLTWCRCSVPTAELSNWICLQWTLHS